MTNKNARPSENRHKAQCPICAHGKCADIEAAFIAWENTEKIAHDFGLGHRTTIYRHVRFFDLDTKRQSNVRVALERIIERYGDPALPVNGGTVVAAVQAYAKINSQGQWVERTETVNLNELFKRLTVFEKETYAQSGALSDSFSQTAGQNATREIAPEAEAET